MQSPWEDKLKKPVKDIKPCRASSYQVEPAGIEPATSGLQSQTDQVLNSGKKPLNHWQAARYAVIHSRQCRNLPL